MKKVGIVTLYHNNSNYGGLLQAYALQKSIDYMGFDVEQICMNFITDSDDKFMVKRPGIKGIIRRFIDLSIYTTKRIYFDQRREAFKKFELSIPHSNIIYTQETINNSNAVYDIFITGSDQVWNLSWFRPEYFLSFVEKNKIKFSYAASMPSSTLTTSQIKMIKEFLRDYVDISVREEYTVDMLKCDMQINAKKVLDPTLLLGKEEWDKCEELCEIPEKYIFCYFLSGSKNLRKLVKKFAKENNLPILTFPHIGSVNVSDINFGNIRLYNVTPGQFIHIIKKATYVITDSFHATVFSIIYNKEFYTISRVGQETMNNRIESLLSLFDKQERFFSPNDFINNYKVICNKKDNIEYYEKQKYLHDLEFSREYLYRNLMVKEVNNENREN